MAVPVLNRMDNPSCALHCAMPQVTDESRRSVLADILTVYGEGGKAMVFTQVGCLKPP